MRWRKRNTLFCTSVTAHSLERSGFCLSAWHRKALLLNPHLFYYNLVLTYTYFLEMQFLHFKLPTISFGRSCLCFFPIEWGPYSPMCRFLSTFHGLTSDFSCCTWKPVALQLNRVTVKRQETSIYPQCHIWNRNTREIYLCIHRCT